MKPFQFRHTFYMCWVGFAIFSSCDNPSEEQTRPEPIQLDAFSEPQPMVGLFVLNLEKAHNAAEYRKRNNVRFEVLANFGSMKDVHAGITMSTTSKDVKVENDDGTYLVYIESTTSLNADSIMHNFSKFKHFAWSHFFSLPKRLRNENVRVEKFGGSDKLGDESFRVRRIRLESRPAHQDIFEWYVVYADRNTGLLRYSAYAFPDELSNSKNLVSHVIEYSDYKLIDDIPIAHAWTFYEWSPDTGLGNKLGDVKLTKVSFLEIEEGFYK